MPCPLWALAVTALGVAAPGDRPPLPRFQLEYLRTPGTDHCPDRTSFARGVSARLGTNPFDETSSHRMVVQIRTEGPGLHGQVEVFEGVELLGSREVISETNDCAELARSLELAVAIAVDPFHVPAEATPEEPAPLPLPPEPAQPPPFTLLLGIGASGSYGSVPTLAPGGLARVDLGWGRAALVVEGRFEQGSRIAAGSGSLAASLHQVLIAPCLRQGWLDACAWASLGAFRGEGRALAEPRRLTTLHAALGGRLAARAALTSHLFLLGHVDLSSPLTPTVLLVDGEQAWRSSPVGISAGLGLGVQSL